MLLKSLYILGLAVSLSACFPINNRMLIDYKFKPLELELIESAMSEWEQATGSPSATIFISKGAVLTNGEFTMHDYMIIDGFARMYRITTNDPGYKSLKDVTDPPSDSYLGISRRGQVIGLVTDQYYTCNGKFYSDCFYSVVLHELGHFFGLGHSEAGIMSQPFFPICLENEAVKAFCNIHRDCVNPHSTCKEE